MSDSDASDPSRCILDARVNVALIIESWNIKPMVFWNQRRMEEYLTTLLN